MEIIIIGVLLLILFVLGIFYIQITIGNPRKSTRRTTTLKGKEGYVYVISNPGSFGEDIYKIGMTQRNDPMKRVNELYNASVPFKWSVHALIYTDDVRKLEKQLHEHFSNERVNKVNKQKEFFQVSLSEIDNAMHLYHNKPVKFTYDYSELDEVIQSKKSL